MSIKKVLASPTYKCIKSDRCSFCYLKSKDIKQAGWKWGHKLRNFLMDNDQIESVAFGYNGYRIEDIFWAVLFTEVKEITITTMPQLVNKTFIGYLANKMDRLDGIALSYNDEIKESWEDKAKIIQSYGINVACNYLLGTQSMPPNIEYDQLNVLSRKPSNLGDKNIIKFVLLVLNDYTHDSTEVVIDNYLSHYLGKKECQAGKEFIHFAPNGKAYPCSMAHLCPISLYDD